MAETSQLRVLVVAADPERQQAVSHHLRRMGPRAEVTTDIQLLRQRPLAGLKAVVIDALNTRPPAAKALTVLRRALPPSCRLLLLGPGDAELEEFVDGVLPFPCGDGVLLDRLLRALKASAEEDALDVELAVDIELRHGRLRDQSLYERLDLPPGARVSEVTSAFDRLSTRFHPDRVASLPEPLRVQAGELYVGIAEAGRILRSPAERSEYHRKLRGEANHR